MENFIDQHSKNYYHQTSMIPGGSANNDCSPIPMDISFSQTVRSTPSRISLDSNDLYFSKRSSDKS